MSFNPINFDWRYDDNQYETETSQNQVGVEEDICHIYLNFINADNQKEQQQQALQPQVTIDDSRHKLLRAKHEKFIRDSIQGLPGKFKSLDSSRPWFALWCLNSLDILDCEISQELKDRTLDTLLRLQCTKRTITTHSGSGGFCGGSHQIPHLAATFAVVMAIAMIGGDDAYNAIDRHAMYKWLMEMKTSNGAFSLHTGGEIDVRGVYCAVVVASVLNIMTPELIKGVPEFIAQCQTCEGGIGPFPGVEAHGGYTLCGLAALEILGRTDVLDISRLAKWMCARQMAFEGGFSGRTNKLVDGCYSYWVGGTFPLLQRALGRTDKDGYMCDRKALQRYILACCQDLKFGGLRDKPGKPADLYHTMYCLVGLSLSQHYVGVDPNQEIGDTKSVFSVPVRMMQWGVKPKGLLVLGQKSCMVKPVHPVYGIPFKPLASMIKYFYSLPPLAETLVS